MLVTVSEASGSRVYQLSGRIDSTNSPELETELTAAVKDDKNPVIDAEKLEYISSAGLRVLLHFRKASESMRIINVCNEVYDILDMTGFTEMMTVEKAYRRLSVDGCEEIGHGANGNVYRLDADTIIKVYKDADALEDIKHERELARSALILGIPTAIPYDVVRVGDTYGSVFELLNAKSLSKLFASDPDNFETYVEKYVSLLKLIHSTEAQPGKFPDAKALVIDWVDFLKPHLEAGQWEKLSKLVNEIPENNHLLHGDYHIKNVMLQNGEAILIDMDTLAVGDPVFEFAGIVNAYIGFVELNHAEMPRFLGIPYETGTKIWERTLQLYFGTEDQDILSAIQDKAMLIGQIRILRRTLRKGGAGLVNGEEQIKRSKTLIKELLERVDSLSI